MTDAINSLCSKAISFALLFSAIACAKPAFAESPRGVGSDSDTIAILSLGHQSLQKEIDEFLLKLDENSHAFEGLSDYYAKAAILRTHYHEAFMKFEKEMRPDQGIFSGLTALIQRYNATFRSSQLPAAQKQALLRVQLESIRVYARSQKEAYSKVLNDLLWSGGVFMAYTDASKFEPSGNSVTYGVYEVLEKHCYSQSCVHQTAMDMSLFVSFVVRFVVRDIVFTLDDSSEVLVGRPSPLFYEKLMTWFIAGLLKTETYPPGYHQLPVTLKKSEWDSIAKNIETARIVAHRREYYIQRMASHLLDVDSNGKRYISPKGRGIDRYEQYFRALCEEPSKHPGVPEIKGCLTQYEISKLVPSEGAVDWVPFERRVYRYLWEIESEYERN